MSAAMIGAAAFLLAAPAAPPPPARTVPIPAFAWTCDVAAPDWRRFTLRGRFAETPVADTNGTEAVVEANGDGGRFAGTHRAYTLSAGAGRATGMWTMIVAAPNRVYYHFMFEFYGEQQLASVMIEEQQLASSRRPHAAVGAGFCRIAPSPARTPR